MTDERQAVVYTNNASNGVSLVTINRPERRNALNLEVKDKLSNILQALEQDSSVRVIVLTGTQKCFVAGTDLNELVDMKAIDHTLLVTDRVFSVLRRCTKPVIAAVEGYALGGGCELALACDIVISGETARFGLPEIKVGVMPGAGGTQRLLRTIGKYLTMRYVLTGDPIMARDGFSMGFVSELTKDGDALQTALELAQKIAAMPPLATKAIKEVVQTGGDASLDTALMLERRAFQLLFDTNDQTEGMRAFLEKREPNFLGH
ncbi:enoyl-CoA hydratase-related protein [Rhizobium sp. BK456]|uniref:enoyl-CoA hydratase-related protein n=1 Tax=Rhizobium sp. BK456 TaxID=2587007 RepID=UPI00161DD795|nr:enoyl-CoA hydratase-related protein [Rhizobium sp. BK456]MBB3527013.1 enoyl-CoA hydratase/carnithine racemase [Rhizobium sp. BK456]